MSRTRTAPPPPPAPHATAPKPGRAPGGRPRRRLSLGKPFIGLGSLAWLVIVLVPLYLMISTSLMDQEQAVSGNPLAPPENPTLDNYNTVLDNDFLTYFGNTVIVAAATVGIVLVLGVPLAYVVVRARSRWANMSFRVFVLGLAIPSQVVVIPLYWMIAELGLYDTLPAVILPTAAFAMPVCVLLLVGSLRDISEELYEAMALDGASQLRMLLQLAVPLSKSGISTVTIYASIQAWNGFMFPLLLTQSEDKRVLTLSLFNYMGQFGVDVPALLAAVVLSCVPIFTVYLVARRALVSGLMGVGGK
ncbi:carbohydrate ABC transporter permease [Streptomyces capparidis]